MISWLWLLISASLSSSSNQENRSLKGNILPFRLSLQVIDGAFSEANRQHLVEKVIPSVEDFFGKALHVIRTKEILKPSKATCNSVLVPQSHLSEGLPADTIIYIHSEAPYQQIAVGKFCERLSGDLKRPVVGSIGINFVQFFFFFDTLQVEYLIREVAHVLVFDRDLFQDFLSPDGSRYFNTQYSMKINYPSRGKTVETIAFPEMLARAREFFDCEIEGVELEDFLNEETGSNQTFWDMRVLTHDIMTSKMSPYAVFSDISLALFKDSGWFFPDYSYSQKLKQGEGAGCDWFEKKCIQNEKASLSGFCDLKTRESICDFFSLGFGNCMIKKSGFIPPHEQYFEDTSLGGNELADFCPMIVAHPQNSCRNDRQSSNIAIGEAKGRDSRCFMQNLMQDGRNFNFYAPAVGGCYVVESCLEEVVTLRVGEVVVDCPYGSQISVHGFQGYLICPESHQFCLNLPCPSLCNGRGICAHGRCSCEEGWGGSDCEIECQKECKSCSSKSQCDECRDGFYMKSDLCLSCDSNCFSCSSSPTLCTSCNEGFELVNGQCNEGCLAHCASCDNPCSRCDLGYYITQGKCSICDKNCKQCSNTANNCISCHEGFKVYLGSCVPNCLSGCKVCEYPCTSCKSGYLLNNGICEMCDNVCATCFENISKCSSCLSGFVLKNYTCVQGCLENCLSCDQPCTNCEDGFYPISGLCWACDKNCLTCSRYPTVCTSCKIGFYLKGASCLKECVENCKSCSFPCAECENGYFEDQGICSKCSDNCKTCGGLENNCLSCNPGFGLIYNECRPGCSDHCYSCDSPCSLCAQGHYLQNGVCLKCDESCLICTASGNNHCTVCAEGYTKFSSVCKKGCQDHCLSCDEPCTICESGFFIYELGCQMCSNGCSTCSSYEKCLSCNEGYGLIGSSCRTLCLDHCTSCDNPCSFCEFGYYPNEGKCEKCQEGCLSCLGKDNCTSCNDGYQLIDNKCAQGCVENCLVCENPCQACASGFVVNVKGLCSMCPSGCDTCASDMSKCYSCKAGYIYDNYSCKKECMPFCLSCDEPCTQCEPGYLFSSGSCVPCLYPCSSCIGNLDRCSSCKKGYKLEDFTCIASCIEHCKTCDDPCELCEEGFLAFRGICQPCSSSCRTCSNSPTTCTSCNPWEVLENNECKLTCTENCIDCSYPCRGCKSGYTLTKGKCIGCKSYLAMHEVSAEFIRDFSGLAVTFSRPVLEVVDNCSEYFKAQTLAMLGIQAMCSWDKEDRLVVVFGENPDFNIRTLLMYPVVTYGSNCESEEIDLQVVLNVGFLPRPKVSLAVPATFSVGCGNDALVIQALTDEDLFYFSFETEPKRIELERFLNGLNGKILVVPENELLTTNLTVVISVTNNLNVTSHVAKQVEITNEKHLTVYIDTGSKLQITTSQSYSISGIVQFGTCFIHEKLVYSWKSIQSPGQPHKEALEIESKSRGSNKLSIPKNSLKAGNIYLFRFEVQNDRKFTFAQVEITVISSKLIARIDRSSSSFPVNEKLVLSAESSFDPDDDSSILKFEWSCSMLTSTCLDSQGKPLITSNKSPKLIIGSTRLKVNSTYMFTVKVSKGDRISRDSIFITGSDSHSFVEIDQILEEVDVGRDLFIYPRYFISANDCSFNWQSLSGTPAVKTMSRLNDPYLIIGKNEMVNGQTYTFKLAGNCQNDFFDSEVSWFTDSPPECSKLSVKSEGNSVSIVTSCIDKSGNSPLSYVYGVFFSKKFIPLKVVHSPSMLLHLKNGNWTVYVDVCDQLKVCRRTSQSVEVLGRKLTEDQHFYQIMKYYPDSIPLGILNSVDTFNDENLKEAFEDLKKYFESQELDLIYMKMAIEAVELLTFSNKSHFMTYFQDDIIALLHKIAGKIKYVDDEVMEYVIGLFSEHEVLEYDKVSALIHQLSGKWKTEMPPGQFNKITNVVQLTRHRFVGHDPSQVYNSSYAKVTNLVLEGNPAKVYDLVIIFYPADPFPVVDINYYSIGEYKSFTYKIKGARDEISIEIVKPFSIWFFVEETGNFKCQQLRGGAWINEGCEIVNITDGLVEIASWHLSTFRIVKSKSTDRGIVALIVNISMIAACLVLTSVFCVADKSKANYIQAPFVPDSPDSPRNEPQEVNYDEQKKKEVYEGRDSAPHLTLASSIESLKPYKPPVIIYHPWFNLIYTQNGERRAASTLHMFSVLFGEFLAVAVLFNPNLYEVFDENDQFTGFSKSQIIVSVVLFLVIQGVSILLVYLNQVNDFTITKKYLGMSISALFIVACSGISLIFAYSYPHKYGLYWVGTYLIVVVGELAIFQNLYWLAHYKFSLKWADLSTTRNMRVFTTES